MQEALYLYLYKQYDLYNVVYMNSEEIKQKLMQRGVIIDCPESVSIDETINPATIAPDVIIYGGCKLSGEETSIGPGSVLGAEAPITLENCQLGHNVQLSGGYFSKATLLDGVSFGSGAHVRGGTLLEENSSCAHTVGLKQTMLMPFVTLGSLINFCDCLMSGGTGSKDHSEVGSSYIHFNFTAHQDKATPSIAGNVSEGIMLDKPPIFLGGQGGLVGPTRLAFGTILAAGTICRRDVLKSGKLVFGQIGRGIKETNYDFNVYGDITRILNNNLIYIGNLHALYAWYQHIRPLMMANDIYTQACIDGAKTQIVAMVEERIKRLGQLADKVRRSLEITESIKANENFVNQWPDIKEKLALPTAEQHNADLDEIVASVKQIKAVNYIKTVWALSPKTKQQCTEWLQGIVEKKTESLKN